MIRYEKFTDSIDEPADPAAKPNKPSEDQEGKKLSLFSKKYREALCNTSLELLLFELSSIANLVIIDLVIQWRSRTTNALGFDADSKSYLRRRIIIEANWHDFMYLCHLFLDTT